MFQCVAKRIVLPVVSQRSNAMTVTLYDIDYTRLVIIINLPRGMELWRRRRDLMQRGSALARLNGLSGQP